MRRRLHQICAIGINELTAKEAAKLKHRLPTFSQSFRIRHLHGRQLTHERGNGDAQDPFAQYATLIVLAFVNSDVKRGGVGPAINTRVVMNDFEAIEVK